MDDRDISPQVARELTQRVVQRTSKIAQSDDFKVYSLVSLALGFPALSLVLYITTFASPVGATVVTVLMALNLLTSLLLEVFGLQPFHVYSLAVGAVMFLQWLLLPGSLTFALATIATWQLGSWIWEGFNKD